MMCNLCDSLCTSHCRFGGAYQCSPSNNFPPLPRSSEALWLLSPVRFASVEMHVTPD